jgi:PAS domain S-box-containing protein
LGVPIQLEPPAKAMSASTTIAPFPVQDVEAWLTPPERDRLLSLGAEAADCFIGIFQAETLAAVHLNQAAQRWLNPDCPGKVYALTLPDIVGVGCLDRFNREIIVIARTMGRWSGECDVRDTWGSETPATFTLVFRSATEARPPLFIVSAIKAGNETGVRNVYDRELLHALLETVPDAIYFKDEQSRFLQMSRAMTLRMGKKEPGELIGKTDFDCFAVEHATRAFSDEQRILASGEPVLDLEEKETWPDGRITWVTTSKFPLRDSDGKVVGTFGISRDITARKKVESEHREMETKLHLAQKLESIGRLAAGIAHEINTPTQYISDNVRFVTEAFNSVANVISARRELLKAGADQPGLTAIQSRLAEAEAANELDYYLKELPSTLAQTAEGLGRISRIVRSLKEFSHPNNAHRGSADLNRAIETAVAVSRHEWKYVAEVVTDFEATLPPVPCVLDEFNQVMLNLIINAAHAIEAAKKDASAVLGRITIRTKHTERHAIVEVEDTGIGIAPEHRDRIFEPFFTTKAPGRGTGQGLGIVHTVVTKHHGGTVDFTTEVGVGTTFRIALPFRAPLAE